MHIEVNQSLQKIAANRTRKLFPEEIDWLLNKNVERFIHSRVKPKKDGSGGYEIDQIDVDAIRTLMKVRVPVTTFKQDSKRVAAILPGDYSYLIADRSEVKHGCDVTPTTGVVTEKLVILPVKKSALASGPFYMSANITLNSALEFSIATYATARGGTYTGYGSKEEIYEVVYAALDYLREKGYRVYWEYYGNKYYPRSIVVVSSTDITGSISIDGVTTAGTLAINSMIVADSTAVSTEVDNRLTASWKISTISDTPFFKTSPLSPLSELENNFLSVYVDTSFIVSKVLISYVRKPRRISIGLGADCNLAPEFHPTICDLTVEYIKGMFNDPNWEVKLKDNMIRTLS